MLYSQIKNNISPSYLNLFWSQDNIDNFHNHDYCRTYLLKSREEKGEKFVEYIFELVRKYKIE